MKSLKKKLIYFAELSDEVNKVKIILDGISRKIKIFDLGCGFGRILNLFKKMGFTNIIGVEKNAEIVACNNRNGFETYTLEDFEQSFSNVKFDLIIMSHIIEHFDYNELKKVMDFYLNYLKNNGLLLIATPLLQQSFYNDFDHVKLYYPIGIDMVFGPNQAQV